MADPTTTLDPVVREAVVAAPIDTCFATFVDGFASWWPPEHHIGEDRVITDMRIEPVVGGRCYDVDTTGYESHWGTVLAIEPPDRFVFAWHVQGDWTIDIDPAHQSEVEVTFTAVEPDRTAVRLEHRNIDRHLGGPDGVYIGVSSPGGWTVGLGRFTDVVEGRPPRPLPAPGAEPHGAG